MKSMFPTASSAFQKSALLGVLASTVLGLAQASADIQVINQLGAGGWLSDDTRSSAGTDLVSPTLTHAGKPGQAPSAGDDAAINSQLSFQDAPLGSSYGGALRISGTTSNSGKSTISVLDLATGFAPASDLLLGSFAAQYRWYEDTSLSARTLALRFGIQSTNFAASQNLFTPIRSGESAWDLVLVHLDPTPVANTWDTESVSSTTGLWNLFDQAGNAYYTTPGGASSMTLADWANDPTFGSALFGAGAKITSIQFGLGSSQANGIAYVESLQTTVANGGDQIQFVPEPTTGLLLALGLCTLAGRRRRAA
jgi:hypothetical protein